MEGRLARRVAGVGIGAKVMIKRNVFLEDHNEVLNGGSCRGTALLREGRASRQQGNGRGYSDCQHFGRARMHMTFLLRSSDFDGQRENPRQSFQGRLSMRT